NVGLPVKRPPTVLNLTFQGPNSANKGCNVVLPAVEPGNGLGPAVTSPDGTSSPATDIITILYADNTLALDQRPITGPTCPTGAILADGSQIDFGSSPGCVTLGAAGIPVNPGDLLMLYNAHNPNGILQTVSSVAGQIVKFDAGDAFNLNGRTTTETSGTILSLQHPGATTKTRFAPSTFTWARVPRPWRQPLANIFVPIWPPKWRSAAWPISITISNEELPDETG